MKRAKNPYPNRQSFRLKRYDYSAPGAYFVTIVAERRLRMFGYVNCGVMHLSPLGAMVHAAIAGMSRCYPGVRIDAFQVMPNHIHVVVWLTGATTSPRATKTSSATTFDTQYVISRRDETVGAGLRVRPRDVVARRSATTPVRTDPIPHKRDVVARRSATTPVRTDHRMTTSRTAAHGSARTGHGADCHVATSRGRARRPAPTASSHGDVTYCVSNLVGVIRDATDPISNVVAPRLTLPDVVQRLKSFTTAQYRHGVARSRWRSIGHRLWQRNYYESIVRDRAALDAIRRYIRNNPPNWSRHKRYKK